MYDSLMTYIVVEIGDRVKDIKQGIVYKVVGVYSNRVDIQHPDGRVMDVSASQGYLPSSGWERVAP